MTQTKTRPAGSTHSTERAPEARDRLTPIAAVAAVLVVLHGVGSSIHFVHTDKALYEMSVGRVLWPVGALSLVVLGVRAVVGVANRRPSSSRVVPALVLVALALVEAYALLKLGPLAPSFD